MARKAKHPRGEDNHSTFSIRTLNELRDKLQKCADEDDVSRNKLINIVLQHYVDTRLK